MKASKREELIDMLDNTRIMYRKSLGLDYHDFFGIEIEYENALKKNVDKYCMNETNGWISAEEFAISNGTPYGGEVVSPILTDRVSTWDDLAEVLSNMKLLGAVSGGASGHIHFDVSMLPYDINVYYDLLKFWSIFEKEIYQFSFGDRNCMRRSANSYAYPIGCDIIGYKKGIDKLISRANRYAKKESTIDAFNIFIYLLKIAYDESRFNGLSYDCIKGSMPAEKNTFEIRTPNGSLNKETWQNNINFFAKMLKYFKTDYDKEYIDFAFEHVSKERLDLKNDLKDYDLDNAVLMSDMIFDNELDKKYFLKQYTKSMSIDTKK